MHHDSGSLGLWYTDRLHEFSSRVEALAPSMHHNSGSIGSCWIKGRNKSLSGVDSLVPLMHHHSESLGSWCIDRLYELLSRVESDFSVAPWSGITQILVYRQPRQILSQSGFIGSFAAPEPGWSLITKPDPDHPKGTPLIKRKEKFVMESDPPARDNVCSYKQTLRS